MPKNEYDFKTVRAAYDDYQRYKRDLKDRIRERVEAEMAKELEERNVELSKMLHEAHANGMPKIDLRNATRKGGNATAFNELWNAYTPAETVDLRRKEYRSDSAKTGKRGWWDGTTFVFNFADTEYRLENFYVNSNGDGMWDMDEDADDYFDVLLPLWRDLNTKGRVVQAATDAERQG